VSVNPFAWYRDECGFSVFPISDNKIPLIKWKRFQEEHANDTEVREWHDAGFNVGIVTGRISNLCVIDCDKRCDAVWFYQNRSKSPVLVQTRRGIHFYFRHPGGLVPNSTMHAMYDVRGDGGYVVAPPSRFGEVRYKFVDKHKLHAKQELPVFNIDWCPRPDTGDTTADIRNGLKYISTFRAVQGQGGDKDTYRAACCLRDSGMDEVDALLALETWNRTNADPPWSLDQLHYKIKQAYRNGK